MASQPVSRWQRCPGQLPEHRRGVGPGSDGVGLHQPPTAGLHPGRRVAGVWDPGGARRRSGAILMMVSENPRRDKRPRRFIGGWERPGHATARLRGQSHGSLACGRRQAGEATLSQVVPHLKDVATALWEHIRTRAPWCASHTSPGSHGHP
jgi:hypothetical protein